MSAHESFFTYRNNELYCDAVPARQIADEAGTPVYIYTGRQIAAHFAEFQRALTGYPHLVCYAVKANSNLEVLRLLARRPFEGLQQAWCRTTRAGASSIAGWISRVLRQIRFP